MESPRSVGEREEPGEELPDEERTVVCRPGMTMRDLEREAVIAASYPSSRYSTFDRFVLEPRLPALREARIICDFEGVVEWVLAVEERSGFRA
ncbi:MAG: hypothetical protein R6U63_01745 [Longimicrobiales bacterium]